MQDIQAIQRLRLEREKRIDFLESRFNSILHAYNERGWSTGKLLLDLGQSFRHDHSYDQDTRELERKIDLYARTLQESI